MKNNIFKSGAVLMIAAASLAPTLTSCDSDYLERAPITYPSDSQILATTSAAQRGAWGICRSMYFMYGVADQIQFFIGEPFINTVYGDVLGSDYYHNLWLEYPSDLMNGVWYSRSDGWMAQMAWMYSYNLINQANKILSGIDSAEGTAEERAYIKAQCLTLRAHAYFKILQFFAPRWEDANGGNVMVAPIRLESSTSEIALSSMNDILGRIHTDLTDAITLFDQSGKERSFIYEPDKSVAQGIYARCAQLEHDWPTARQMAHDARQNYAIMSANEYLGGFAEVNDEWMWGYEYMEADPVIALQGWAALYGCNGGYTSAWGYGGGFINYDLYKKMDDGDIRKQLFWTPDKQLFPPLVTAASFWNEDYVENNMNINISNNGEMNLMAQMCRNWANNSMPGNNIAEFVTPAYRKTGDTADDALNGTVPFGAQTKFWARGKYTNGSYPYMRGAEMAFIEAEAAYMLNDETAARNILDEVRSKRGITGNVSESGAALLTKIQTEKRIELWGEGFCWTDLKRWNLPVVRRAWKAGDVNSGNCPETHAGTIEPTAHNNWVFPVPETETDFNSLINHAISSSPR